MGDTPKPPSGEYPCTPFTLMGSCEAKGEKGRKEGVLKSRRRGGAENAEGIGVGIMGVDRCGGLY